MDVDIIGASQTLIALVAVAYGIMLTVVDSLFAS